MSFTNPVKDYVVYKSRKYRISLSFRLIMMYFQIMKDDGLIIEEKVDLSCQDLVKDDVSNLKPVEKLELLKQIYDDKIITERDKRRMKLGSKGKPSFDFNQDADLISSAFQQQYGVDLDTAHLSWQKFTSMLDGLTEDTQFRKVTQYRTIKISDDMSQEQQEFIKRMKLLFSLDKHVAGEKLTRQELDLELANLDMPHKALRMKELRDKGLI